jgi:hypothetical protein
MDEYSEKCGVTRKDKKRTGRFRPVLSDLFFLTDCYLRNGFMSV